MATLGEVRGEPHRRDDSVSTGHARVVLTVRVVVQDHVRLPDRLRLDTKWKKSKNFKATGREATVGGKRRPLDRFG